VQCSAFLHSHINDQICIRIAVTTLRPSLSRRCSSKLNSFKTCENLQMHVVLCNECYKATEQQKNCTCNSCAKVCRLLRSPCWQMLEKASITYKRVYRATPSSISTTADILHRFRSTRDERIYVFQIQIRSINFISKSNPNSKIDSFKIQILFKIQNPINVVIC